ncbi:MAG: hypothetical protein JNL11_14660 [Bdellovibrionaceae bacterium]|nr:hypothetical protein [Pseudobdellovibrionaceae bacterium]
MKSKLIMLFLWLLSLTLLSACTGGDVLVNSLGLTLESVSLKQSGSQNDFLEVNKDSRILRFKITCTEEYSAVEIRKKGTDEWLKGTTVSCSEADTFFWIDLKNLNIELSEHVLNLIEFRFVSEKGYSDPIEKGVAISRYMISSASASITDFSGFTNTLHVNVQGRAQFSYKNGQSHQPSEIYITDLPGCTAGGHWEIFKNEMPWTLKKSNDINQVYMKFRDAGLTESECTSASTYHDNTAPVASQLSFVGFPATNLTNLPTISMNILANGDPFEMKISNSPICIGGDWENYATLKNNWTVGFPNGLNPVSIKFRDQAHNESGCLAANYTHDNLAPSVPIMTLINGSNPGQSPLPGFQMTGLSIGDQLELYGDGTCTQPLYSWILSGTSTFYFPTLLTDGNYQYFVRIRDAATNWLECNGPLYIYKLDRLPPTALSTGHPTAASNVAAWTETIYGSDLYEYKFKIGTAATTTCSDKTVGYSNWIRLASQPSQNLDITALVDGNTTLCVYGRDQALNEQASPTAYTWTKNTSSLQATLVTNTLPSAISNITALNVTVTGYLIDQYKYKVGNAASTDCTSGTGYIGWISTSTNITASVTTVNHGSSVRLCVIGRNSGSLTEQPLSLETKYDFLRDTQPATVTSIDFPPADNYLIGDDLIFGVNFNEEVVLDPTAAGTRSAEIRLNGGALNRTAQFYRRISDTKLEFLYKVVAGDTGNFGYGNQLNLPTGGFIKDKAGNSLITNSGAVTGNLTNPGVQAYNENPNVSVSWATTDYFLESSNQISFKVSVDSAISVNLNFTYQVETYTLDGLTKNLITGNDTITAGQTYKLVTVTGINNSTMDGLRGVAVDLRKIKHGHFGTKTITGTIHDDETPDDGAVVDFAMGSNDTCFYTTNGRVYCFGRGESGELGLGTAAETRPLPAKIGSLSGVTQLMTHESSLNHYCAKAADGIYCWGYGGKYAIGSTTGANHTSPYKVSGIGTNPSLVTLSRFSLTCSYDNGVGTKCWGENAAGLAGINSASSLVTAPSSVVATINNYIKTIESSATNTSSLGRCALIDDGDSSDGYPAYCWGEGTSALSGLGTTQIRIPTLLMTPQVMDIAAMTRGFCTYGDFDVGKPGYEVACWGSAASSSYVLGYTNAMEYTPKEIPGFENTEKVYFMPIYACAVGNYEAGTTGLEIKCWGSNSSGRLGLGPTGTNQIAPGATVGISISSVDDLRLGNSTVCAKKTDGTLWCWGNGFTNAPTQQLAAGTFNSFYPGSGYAIIQTSSNGLLCLGSACASTQKGTWPSSGVTKFKMSEVGNYYCFIYSGHLACAGNWDSSRFGFGTTDVTESTITYTSSELNKMTDDGYFCLETPTSSYYQCRSQNQFVLGKPSTSSFTSLLETKIPSTVKKIALGYYSFAFIDSLDNLIQATNSSPTSMQTFGVGNNFQNVASTKTTSTSYQATTADGFYNYTTATLPAKQSVTMTPANTINNGSYHYCFPALGGTAKCGATNSAGISAGQLGDNLLTGANNVLKTPLVTTDTQLTDVVDTATGGSRSCARTNAGELYCWGANIDSAGTALAPMARLMMAGVLKVKMDSTGRIFVLKTDNKLYVAPTSGITFTEKFTNVTDFWGTSEAVCVKRADGHFYCIPESGKDLSVVGRFFDKMPFTVY